MWWPEGIVLWFSFWGMGFGLECQDGGLYPFRDDFLGLRGVRRVLMSRCSSSWCGAPPGLSSLPIMRHRWSASTSFVLAARRALYIDPSDAATGSAMIKGGRITLLSCTWVTRTRTRTKSSNRPTLRVTNAERSPTCR